MKKFFRFSALIFLIIMMYQMACGQADSTSVLNRKVGVSWQGIHTSNPVYKLDTTTRERRIVLPSPIFIPCEQDLALVDNSNLLILEDRIYVFIGYVSKSHRCFADSAKLAIFAIELSNDEVKQELKWQDVVLGEPFYLNNKTLVGNYVSVYVRREELARAVVLKE